MNQGPSQVQVPMNLGTPDALHVHHCALLQQRRVLLLADFPDLGGIMLHAGPQTIASNINTLVKNFQVERATKATSKALATTMIPNDLLDAAGTSILLRILQVGTEPKLTGFWHQSAQAKGKSRQLMELNNTLATEAIARGINTNVHVTPSIKDKVLQLKFSMVN